MTNLITEKTENTYLWHGEITQEDYEPLEFWFYGTQTHLAQYIITHIPIISPVESFIVNDVLITNVNRWINKHFENMGVINSTFEWQDNEYTINYLSYAEITEITNLPQLISDYQLLTGDSHE